MTWAFEFEDQPALLRRCGLSRPGRNRQAGALNAFRLMGKLGGDWIETESDGALPLDQVVAQSVTAAADVNAVATRGAARK